MRNSDRFKPLQWRLGYVFGAGILFLASCGSYETDPSAGGFINGVRAINDGAYEKRIEALEQELNDVQSAIARDQKNKRKLESQRRSIQSELARLRSKVRS